MNTYVCFFNAKRIEVTAESLYSAKVKAIAQFNPPKAKAHMVSVMLAERDNAPVIHTAVD
jgi:hypothetical protein